MIQRAFEFAIGYSLATIAIGLAFFAVAAFVGIIVALIGAIRDWLAKTKEKQR